MTAPSTVRCSVQVQADTSAFPIGGGSGTLRVTTNRECSWSARADASWVGLTAPAEGQGEGAVTFSVMANGDPVSRKAGISVNDQRVEISQGGRPCEFQVSSTREVVEAAGGDRSVQVGASSTLCDWTSATADDWISITSGAVGKGNGAVSFRVSPASGLPRTGALTVAGQKVVVEQGMGCTYAVGGSAFSVGAPASFLEVPVTAGPGCPWTAESRTSWIGIRAGSSGSGSGHVRFAIERNEGAARQGSATVAGRTLSIAQDSGCTYSISPTSQSVAGTGGSVTVSIATGPDCAWTAASPTQWISVSASSGRGPAQVQVTAAANPSIARTGSLTIAGHAFTMEQPSPCTFQLVPSHFNYEVAGGPGATLVIVSGFCTWEARSHDNWITITSGAPGTANGLVQFLVGPNDGAARTGSLTIAGERVTVAQAGR